MRRIRLKKFEIEVDDCNNGNQSRDEDRSESQLQIVDPLLFNDDPTRDRASLSSNHRVSTSGLVDEDQSESQLQNDDVLLNDDPFRDRASIPPSSNCWIPGPNPLGQDEPELQNPDLGPPPSIPGLETPMSNDVTSLQTVATLDCEANQALTNALTLLWHEPSPILQRLSKRDVLPQSNAVHDPCIQAERNPKYDEPDTKPLREFMTNLDSFTNALTRSNSSSSDEDSPPNEELSTGQSKKTCTSFECPFPGCNTLDTQRGLYLKHLTTVFFQALSLEKSNGVVSLGDSRLAYL
ncbi:hypothetical protein MMC20_000680 [Loxospora ochrophaea]|nr:hypothetical protein [Loxospora ochrophaea]